MLYGSQSSFSISVYHMPREGVGCLKSLQYMIYNHAALIINCCKAMYWGRSPLLWYVHQNFPSYEWKSLNFKIKKRTKKWTGFQCINNDIIITDDWEVSCHGDCSESG